MLGYIHWGNKKILIIIFTILLLSSGISSALNTNLINGNISTNETIKIGNTGSFEITLKSGSYSIDEIDQVTRIKMEGFGYLKTSGKPMLPTKTYLIGVPPGSNVISIELISEKHEVIKIKEKIENVPQILRDNTIISNEEISKYSYETYPSDYYDFLGMGQLRKYSFAKIQFCPVIYNNQKQELFLYKEITLKIKYEIVEKISDKILSDSVMDEYASSLIENFNSISPMYQPSNICSLTDNYDYVIITTESVEDAAIFFKSWKDLIGFNVKIVNTSWINSVYGGVDLPEKIRNFLIDNYINWGIKYVLIIGSHQTIPMRYCIYSSDDPFAIPSDYYYSDLTGDWDSNGDGIFVNSLDSWPDFTSEVFIGRIPVDDPDTVKNICQKTINYEQDEGEWKKNVLLLGGFLNFYNQFGNGLPETDGGIVLNKLDEDVFSPAGFTSTSLYEKDGLVASSLTCNFPLTRENALNQWTSKGYGIINWNTHGTSNGISHQWWLSDRNLNNVPDRDELEFETIISASECSILDDTKPSIIFSCSCSGSEPEDPNNLGKSLLVNGAVAYIGGTDLIYYYYGWNNIDQGGSMTIDYIFFDYFINSDMTCSEALSEALVYCWYDHHISIINENMFLFNLYGDPSISFETYDSIAPPEIPRKPSGLNLLEHNIEYSYTTNAINSDGKPLYYLWDWGDDSFSELLGPYNPGETIESSHVWTKSGDFMISVKAINMVGDESVWSEPLLIHVKGPVLNIERISGGIKVNAVIKNIGDDIANDVQWNISFYGGSILLGSFSSGTIPSIMPGEEETIVSRLIYGFGFPTVIVVQTAIPGSTSDIEIQSADLFLIFIKIK